MCTCVVTEPNIYVLELDHVPLLDTSYYNLYDTYGYVSLKQLVCNIKLKSSAYLPLVCILKNVVICNDCDWNPV